MVQVSLVLNTSSQFVIWIINSTFHARKQVRGFLNCFGISLLWSFFQWFYTGGESCGFLQFPTFGLKAWKQTYALLVTHCLYPYFMHNCIFVRQPDSPNYQFFLLQVLFWFQPHICWCGNDLLTPCKPLRALWRNTFLGDNVATDQHTKG